MKKVYRVTQEGTLAVEWIVEAYTPEEAISLIEDGVLEG